MTRPHKLNDVQKQNVLLAMEYKSMTITELANMYGCHPRTIYRVLEEAGMGTGQSDRKASPGKKALEIITKYGISVEQLESVLKQAITFTPPAVPRKASQAAALFHPAPTVLN